MKKLFKGILCTVLCGAAVFGVAACGGGNDGGNGGGDGVTAKVYAPDGAPALALANLLANEQENDGAEYGFDVEIVNASTIQTYVTGASPKADFCIMPVNLAANTVGNGTVYQMLGTVTNGNLYFVSDASKNLPELTAENIETALLGKTLGVIQYEQVPGLTLRVVLNRYEIPYAVVESNDDAQPDRVNIRAVQPAQVAPATGCDYYLCPEPARTTRITALSGALTAAGSLQELYGGEGGYPQAVLVAKKSFIQENQAICNKMITYMEGSASYLASATPSAVYALVDGHRTAGMSDIAFAEAQLTAEVIANCSVYFTKSVTCKQAVLNFLDEFRAVAPATATPANEFFYLG